MNQLVALMIVLAGCGTPSSGGDGADGGASSGGGGSDQLGGYQSGTRIKMRELTTPDGARQFEGWYDTQLDVDCAFFVSTDGVTRCLPAAGGEPVYFDAACTMHAVAVTCAQAPTYVTFATPVCPQQLESTAYPVEANVSATGGYYLLSGTTCSRLDDASVTTFAVGPALPNSMFQSATEDIE
ncbi:MAG TPA: hypothetical protein VGG74_12015 [Kofleriaceae bacterium]|jgi:hypothetical protein